MKVIYKKLFKQENVVCNGTWGARGMLQLRRSRNQLSIAPKRNLLSFVHFTFF